MKVPSSERPLHWVGSSKKDLLSFPEEVVDDIGYALGAVQLGGTVPSAKPWKAEGTDIDLIHERLKAAHADHEVRYGKTG